MSYQNLRRVVDEIRAVQTSVKPFADKVGRGERLSAVESRKLAESADKLGNLRSQEVDVRAALSITEDAAGGMGGVPSLSSDDAESRAFSRFLRDGTRAPELRAAGEGTNSAGGYLVPPGWWQRLQIAQKAYGGTSNDFQLVETESGQSMLWATNDPTTTVGTLIAENTQISDVDYTFGQGTLGAYMYTSGVQLVSFQLANDSAFDIDAYVAARVGESLGRATAAAAISGTGSSQPLGVITALAAASTTGSGGQYTLGTGNKVNVIASGSSITTNTALVTELTAGALNPNSVNGLIKSVDRAYRAQGAKFYMNDTTFQNHKLVADSYGQPLYKGLWDDANPTLMGYDCVVDNNISALTASTASGIIFGHMPSAMVLRRVTGDAVVDRVQVGQNGNMMKLDQRWADFLQVGFIGWTRFDMRSNDLRAATVVVPAAS